jgi:glucokinase
MNLGIDIGGTNIKLCAADKNGTVSWSASLPTPVGASVLAYVDAIVEAVASHAAAPQAVGVGVPGAVDNALGLVLFAPNLGLRMVDIATPLATRLGTPVSLANDADCAALAEARLGAGRGYHSMLMLTLGTAVGGALVVEGELSSALGPGGGEFGHIPLVYDGLPCPCGKRGCFEQYASANALAAQGAQAMGLAQVSAEDVMRAVQSGDERAKAAFDRYIDYLCQGIGGLVNVFRPQLVCIGGGLAGAGEPLLSAIRAQLPNNIYAAQELGCPTVALAQLGAKAGCIGAALLPNA